MQPPVWTSTVFTLIGTFVFILDVKIHADEVFACYNSPDKCGFYNLSCPNDSRIRVEGFRYGKTGAPCNNNSPPVCKDVHVTCCARKSDNCIVEFPANRLESVRDSCWNKPRCGPFPADQIQFNASHQCKGDVSSYIIVVYTCVRGTDTTVQLTSTTNGLSSPGNTSSSSGKSEDGISVPAIIGVVIAVIIVIAVVAVALIIYKRRQKKSTKDATHIYNLPKGMTNYVYERPVESGKSSEVVETSNYDVISDESVLNYSLPEKNKKDNTNIPVTVDKFSDVSADEYDKIEFKMTGANTASNYDRLAALKGNIGDDPYSHVSNRSKSVTTATATVNDYSLCKPNSKDTLRNGDDYSLCKPNSRDTLRNGDDYSLCKPNSKDTRRNGDDYSLCKPSSKDTLRNGDDYSHADLAIDCTIKPESDISEEDSYNHIDFGDTKHTMQNGTAINDEERSESETNSTTCTVVKPRDMVNENHLLK